MTIASEITRLQWAKDDARASIIAKGVSVPASAKLDTYHDYIDLIQTWWYFNGVKLKDYRRYQRDSSPTISGHYSWEENGKQYWLIVWSQNESYNNSRYRYGGVWVLHEAWSDLQYFDASGSGSSPTYSASRYWFARGNYFIKNTTAWIVRGYIYVVTDYSSNRIHTFETVYDYINWTCTYSLYSTGTDSNLANVVNVPAWYEVVSGDTWIKDVTPHNTNSDGYFYITLK